MMKNPVPVIMVSSVTVEGAQGDVTGIGMGSGRFHPQTIRRCGLKIAEIQKILVPKVLAARYAGSKLKRLTVAGTAKVAVSSAKALSSRSVSVTRGTKLIAIGCSTGGPKPCFRKLSRRFPPIVRRHRHRATHAQFVYRPFADQLEQPLCIGSPGSGRRR
ncbi:MAG: hypothetical protein MRJ92_05930 [Nitrospira sp.]|nr:hypothetical protein [Nitrospira sp.]